MKLNKTQQEIMKQITEYGKMQFSSGYNYKTSRGFGKRLKNAALKLEQAGLVQIRTHICGGRDYSSTAYIVEGK